MKNLKNQRTTIITIEIIKLKKTEKMQKHSKKIQKMYKNIKKIYKKCKNIEKKIKKNIERCTSFR